MKLVSLLILTVLISACATTDHRDVEKRFTADQIYQQINNEGSTDTVELLRQGLTVNHHLGQTDPFLPLRKPGLTVPVWKPTYTNSAGDRVSGHWKNIVIEDAEWLE